MCGIFGTTDYNENTELIMEYLAYEMEDRGKDSWGITNGTQVLKRMGYITATFEVPTDWKQMIGHCRASSVGKVNIQNQHPFEFVTNKGTLLVGIHNGTLANHSELNKKYNRDFDVDTRHLYAHIAEEKSFKDIRGSAVLAFYEDGKLNLGRFNSTSLHVVRLHTGEVVFASTSSAVTKAVRAGGGSIEANIPIAENRFYEYDPATKAFRYREVEGFGTYTYSYSSSGRFPAMSKGGGRDSKKSPEKIDTPSEPSSISYNPIECGICDTTIVDFNEDVVCQDCLAMYELRLEFDSETPGLRGPDDINYPTGAFGFDDPQDWSRFKASEDPEDQRPSTVAWGMD